jgi:Zn-dependent peptidase ImmA (M78 family)/predicted secreted protein
MATKRNAILSGTRRAAELHEELGLKKLLAAGDEPVDVLAVMKRLGLAVLFRPLDGLLGAYIPLGRAAGAVITTERSLHIQRFTEGHELGHHVCNHKLSADDQVGFVARGDTEGFDAQEVEADAFASEFLLPKWLIAAHVNRRKWGRRDLLNPSVVYQLSLRLGMSYSAICWAMAGHGLVTAADARALLSTPPKASKQLAAAGSEPSTWHADIWEISERDNGALLMGGPDDLLLVALQENTAGGYAWNTDGAKALGVSVEKDTRELPETRAIGGPITRTLVLKGDVEGLLTLEKRRPWERKAASADSFELRVALHGKEIEGLPRSTRRAA